MGKVALEEIRRQAAALGPWFHNIDLDGVATAPEHFLGEYPAVKWPVSGMPCRPTCVA